MTRARNSQSKLQKFGYGSFLIAALFLIAVTLAFSADNKKVKGGTIDAIAMGTSTQLGRTVNIKVHINEFSKTKIEQSSLKPISMGKIRVW